MPIMSNFGISAMCCALNFNNDGVLMTHEIGEVGSTGY
jgi:hypothetical protein